MPLDTVVISKVDMPAPVKKVRLSVGIKVSVPFGNPK